MFECIDELIRKVPNALSIEVEQYGSELLLGIDDQIFSEYPIKDLLVTATSPGDMEAMEAYNILWDFYNKYPGFLFVRGKTLFDGLERLEARAVKWKKLSELERVTISFELLQRAYPKKNWEGAKWILEPSRYA